MKRTVSATTLLPHVFINCATTADGKLAPPDRDFIPFGSKRDQEHMLELRATADAVMSGARTVDLCPVKMGTGGEKYRRLRLSRGLPEYNLRIIVSGGATLNPRAEIFKHRFSPIIILATGRASKAKLRGLERVADEVKVCGDEALDFNYALRWLREKWNVKNLLCEGGGEINGALFEAGLVDELHVTLCPVIFGGRHAPTLADGAGFQKLSQASRLKMTSQKHVGDELFQTYRVLKK